MDCRKPNRTRGSITIACLEVVIESRNVSENYCTVSVALTNMNESTNIRFSTTVVCRLCLNQDPFALDIFSKLAESKEIGDKIRLCIPGLKISEGDALPKHICFRCLYKLELTSDFIKQCILAQSVLTKTSHGHEGEPLAKARKTNVFSSLHSSEQDINGTTQAESDSSFDDLDIHCISDGFKEHLNGNRMIIQAYTEKKQDKSISFGFNGAKGQYERKSPNLKKSNQVVIHNWKDNSTHYKRTPCATAHDENSFDNPTAQLPQEFVHNSYFKSDRAKSIKTHKWKGNKRTEEYPYQGNNKHNVLNGTSQKSSPLQKLISSPVSFVRQLPSGSINQVNTQIENDSDEEINQHIKILNSLRNKCPL